MCVKTSRMAIAAIMTLIVHSLAGAQQASAPSPMMQHYRAYNAAIEKGDLGTAEAEASAALAASVERYGDGGRTAVFALNLAGVRLVQGKHDAAVEPARKALALAEAQGDASGVDRRVARLILGRAELRTGGNAAAQRLEQAVKDVATVPELADEAYPAAVELATYAFESRRFAMASDAWAASAQIVAGSGRTDELAVAAAKVGQAAAGIMLRAADVPRQQTGTRLPVTGQEFQQFDTLLVEAMDAIHPHAVQESPTGDLTRTQRAWAQAYAWRLALASKLEAEHRELPPGKGLQHDDAEIGAARYSAPACPLRTVVVPPPAFPPEKELVGGIGAVVLKLTVDDAGKLARVQVAGSVGGDAFVRAVTTVADQWHFEKKDGSPANCRMTQAKFFSISYHYR